MRFSLFLRVFDSSAPGSANVAGFLRISIDTKSGFINLFMKDTVETFRPQNIQIKSAGFYATRRRIGQTREIEGIFKPDLVSAYLI